MRRMKLGFWCALAGQLRPMQQGWWVFDPDESAILAVEYYGLVGFEHGSRCQGRVVVR